MAQNTSQPKLSLLSRNRGLLITILALAFLPFLVGLFEGASPAQVWLNQGGTSKFVEGLAIEIFILAIFALSYDLLFGITGLLSLGHSMFFATGAYLTGVLLKNFQLPLGTIMLWVLLAALVNAILFGLVLPRVKGITFALVTLGIASVFHIVIMSRELGEFTGADVGLQGIPTPAYISPATERLRFYFVALALAVFFYLVYRRFVSSPVGRVCVAIRENEDRALMLGYNTFIFKLAALMLSSITASVAGMVHALYQPIVSPNTAGLVYTIMALLVVLIGGVGTLSGALIGAVVYRLLDFGLRRYLGVFASFVNGAIYILIVLFLPYGIVGTWKLRSLDIRQGWSRLLGYLKFK
ncbi:MAG: branched-chain amino acid ABC transporter permease [Anaerolineales bacterium]|nr:branched-chain amino acid ABC transporter permease [Anaerolineales bacterium]